MAFLRGSFLFSLMLAVSLASQAQSFVSRWQDRVNKTQAEQPHWVTPLATVTPRLEQEFRSDFVRQITPQHTDTWNYGNGKGLELIPERHTELLFNISPYIQHNSLADDGFGDVSFLGKYRILAGNEERRSGYILTAFLGATIPTGSYKNGLTDATVTPTLAGGKGWGRFDFQTTLGGQLPLAHSDKLGRPVAWNTALQYRASRMLWPEVEFNTTHFNGGASDGKTQNFVTPGMIGRFHLHNRIGLTVGAGMQIATSQFHTYDHGLLLTARMPF
jgi:hypothetical protein